MVDGDKSLVIADKDFIKVVKRNMEGIVPLYYNMRKAESRELNNQSIYDGLNAAFTSSGIGLYSNNISKIWNSNVFVNGTEEEKEEAIKVIKLLCMENNFVIDAAKTLYIPTRPEWFKPMVSKFTQNPVPYFFKYAKDKEDNQVAEINDCFVNKLTMRVKNVRLNFRNISTDKFNYRILLSNYHFTVDDIKHHPIVIEYQKIMKDEYTVKYYYQMMTKCRQLDNYKDIIYQTKSRQDFIIEQIRNEIIKRLTNLGYAKNYVVDVLVSYLYNAINTKNKATLWFCFGDEIVMNIKNNLGSNCKINKSIQCIDCGEWFEVPIKNNTVCRCPQCTKIKKNNDSKIRMRNMRKSKKQQMLRTQ